jgi:hypothetical protein
MSLLDTFKAQIRTGLNRHTIVTASQWAENYRMMGKPEEGPWTFHRRPFLRELHDSKAPHNVIRKAAQLGLTETALNLVLFNMDMHGRDSLYVLPTLTDARDFSSGRFNAAIDSSAHIAQMFSDVKNVGHKRAKNANLYIRGGKSNSGLKSVPIGILVLDEVDEMSKRAVALAYERLSGQDDTISWCISTPTVPKVGVSEQFELSTQEWYYFDCPLCSRKITLRWPESFVVVGDTIADPDIDKSHIKCNECNGTLPFDTKVEYLQNGHWEADFPGRTSRGFALNQLFSPTVTPEQFATSYIRGLSDPAAEQEFFNSKCGIPYVVAGGQVLDEEIEQCVGNYMSGTLPPGRKYRGMGVDVGGRWLHYEVDEWDVVGGADINAKSKCRVVEVGKVQQFEEIDKIMRRLQVHFGVVDANPEKRKALELAARFNGRFAICYYAQGLNSRSIRYSEDERTVTVDRTAWHDMSLGRFRGKTIVLPSDISLEYRQQIKEPVRRYRVNDNGEVVGEYLSGGDDHFAHARAYSEIALTTFMPLMGASHNIESPL